jgi:hypothetical protein
LECLRLGPPPDRALTLVFLHEGLGCAAMWLLERTGVRDAILIGHSDGGSIALIAPPQHEHESA